MTKAKVVLTAVLTVSLTGTLAFAWGPNTHGRMALNALNYPTITPYLAQYGLNAGTIAGMAWELDLPDWKSTYHDGWSCIQNREWLTNPKWNNLDESRRLAFLLHIACDSGVPMSHSPANQVWTNTTIEALLEARVDTWQTSPSITPYTGTYSEKMTAFYNQEIALAQWAKSKLTIWNVGGSTGQTAGWTGVTYGQNLAEAMLLEYFQTKAAGGGMSVPEPMTLTLLGAGAMGLLRRRKK